MLMEKEKKIDYVNDLQNLYALETSEYSLWKSTKNIIHQTTSSPCWIVDKNRYGKGCRETLKLKLKSSCGDLP